MNQVTFLLNQTKDAYNWVNKLATGISSEKWDEVPGNIESTVTWQLGHLLLSFNFHSIMVIQGNPIDLYEKIDIRTYSELFFKTPAVESVGRIDPDVLLKDLQLVQEKSLETIQNLKETDLSTELEPTDFPHPIAKTKLEALDWNIKHTMWHCGQLAMLKRVLAERYDFITKK